MLNHLVFFHKFKPTAIDLALDVTLSSLAEFNSCLRRLIFVAADEPLSSPFASYDKYEGSEAYQFLLEIICGLHSPLIGETEIMGQFKEFVDKTSQGQSHLNNIFLDLLRDAKLVRRDCLQDLGAQSYGSILRKLIGKNQNIAIIGGGKLAQEILPWLTKDAAQINIFVRNPDASEFASALVLPLSRIKQSLAKYIILAAPLSATEVETLCVSNQAVIIDLRGEGRFDAIGNREVINLDDVFSKIEISKKQAEHAKTKAIEIITSLTEKRFLSEKSRPFGWEDIYVFSNRIAHK